ncbi:MAG: hypothetical protein HYX79_06770 [Chloroflexi bacterium]|nr:hypothetical protein [Chloroflexota bacterium]
MSEDITIAIIALSYTLIGGIPFWVYLNRGRKSGKISPKLAATLIALFYTAIPLAVIAIFLRESLSSWYLQYWGIVMAIFLLTWLAVYVGPFGIGLTGRWDNYVYPERKKGTGQPVTTENKTSDTHVKPRSQASWRLFVGKMVLGELVVFIGSGLVFNNTYLIITGIGIAVTHVVIFLAIWYRKQEQLKKKGWRW